MKSLFILGLLALCACAPAPKELPEDFNADFEF
jgi:hypothetical protein